MGIAYNTSIVRDGLVLHLDAANVKSYPGSGTAWNDLSGNEFEGTLIGNAAFTTYNGVPCIDLDGVDDYISVSNPDLLNPGSSSFSIETWISQDDTGYNGIVEARGSNLHGFLLILNYLSVGQLAVFLNSITDTSQEVHYSPINSWSDINTWMNLVVVVDKQSNTILFYRNGVQIGTAVGIAESGSLDGGGPKYWIGADLGGPEANLKINSLRHYNKKLTEDEIKKNFEAMRGRFGI